MHLICRDYDVTEIPPPRTKIVAIYQREMRGFDENEKRSLAFDAK